MYDGRDKNINSQTNYSINYIYQTHKEVVQNEIYCNLIMINIFLEYVLEYLIDKKDVRYNNY